jgi:putative peptide zinc metalloprotease protein
MSLRRTTFSDNWFSIANLHPRLHPGIAVFRQHFRGELWFVLQDPVNNQHFRITGAAWNFLGLLDGKRSVDEAWKICTTQLGDAAPTQGEALQLLGQLHTGNLLLGDMPSDTAGLLERYKTRQQRELLGKLRSILFIQIPLWDPNRFLTRLAPLFAWLCSPVGMVLWIFLALAGLSSVVGRTDELMDQTASVLTMGNLHWLYLCFVVTKVLHELGHGFACKIFGLKSGGRGGVHTMGVMLMLLTPVPYVDCSSAWTLRSKWQRVVISSAGMMVELMLAAVAALVWVRTSPGSLEHALAYNVMFVCSVSTLIFNGNPLLRYDAYYILSDLLEIPNLSQQSNSYVMHLAKKHLLGVKDSTHNAEARRERHWLFSYAIGSFIYRWIVVISIVLMLTDYLFILGVVFGLLSAWQMLLPPLGKYFLYLLNHHELSSCRERAWLVTSGGVALLLAALFLMPVPDRIRLEGVVEPKQITIHYTRSAGFISEVQAAGSTVTAGQWLVRGSNDSIQSELQAQEAEIRAEEGRFRLAQTLSAVDAQVSAAKLASLRSRYRDIADKASNLEIRAEQDGVWQHDHLEKAIGAYAPQGKELGKLLCPENLIIRAVASQKDAQLLDQARKNAELRVKGRPASQYTGNIEKVLPFGQQQLPSQALGYAAGGEMITSQDDPDGRKAAERVFEIVVDPDLQAQKELSPGQIIGLRFTLPPKPLGLQLWRSMRQSLQSRFHLL